MNKKFSIMLVLIFIGLTCLISLGVARVDTAAEFLTIGVGARPSGMGEACVALVDDVSSLYWNPAGLSYIKQREFIVMYSKMFPDVVSDMYYSFVGFGVPVGGRGVLGGSFTYFFTGTHTITDDRGEKTGEFNTYDLAGTISYGCKIKQDLSLGLTFKYIYSSVYYIKGRAYAFDLGGIYRMPIKGLSMGLALQNFGTKMTMIDSPQADILPQNLKLGIGYILTGNVNKLGLAFDFNQPVDELNKQGILDTEAGLNMGMEYTINDKFFVRMGYCKQAGEIEGVTWGIGMKTGKIRLDFANVPSGEQGDTNRFSLISTF